ncbi:MAG: hypothetical protein K2Q14_08235 [Gammaproteobacteria bacterium]|nr:hypothetical protein [Gammaproteobacteria bacterium]
MKKNIVLNVLDAKTHEIYEESLSLLKILALGQKQIDAGAFRSANDVFDELDKEQFYD